MQATVILDRNGRHRRRNAYLLKIGAKSFGDGIQLIGKIQKVIWDHLLASKAVIIQK